MRVLSRSVIAVTLALLLAIPAQAQRQQRQQQGAGGVAGLLENESVQKELKMEKDQADKVKEAVAKVTDKHKDERAKLADLGREERRTETQKLNAIVNAEVMAAIGDILKPEQVKRLKQIELQQAGSRAFTRADVATALKLTDEQKEKIKTINEDAGKQLAELRQGGNAQNNREKIAAVNKETTEKVQGVLTDDQKKAFKEMTGEPFTIVRQRRQQNP